MIWQSIKFSAGLFFALTKWYDFFYDTFISVTVKGGEQILVIPTWWLGILLMFWGIIGLGFEYQKRFN